MRHPRKLELNCKLSTTKNLALWNRNFFLKPKDLKEILWANIYFPLGEGWVRKRQLAGRLLREEERQGKERERLT